MLLYEDVVVAQVAAYQIDEPVGMCGRGNVRRLGWKHACTINHIMPAIRPTVPLHISPKEHCVCVCFGIGVYDCVFGELEVLCRAAHVAEKRVVV